MVRPRISVNHERCPDPRACRRCLECCPEGVILVAPTRDRAPGVEAGAWQVVPVFEGRCSGCGLCVARCPSQALSIGH